EGGTMTETEWLRCDKPHSMLTFLRDRVSKRKLRLYACACCRRVWPLLQDARSRAAVQVAEQYADSLLGYVELNGSQEAAREAWRGLARAHPVTTWGAPPRGAVRAAAHAAATAGREAWSAAWQVADEFQGGHPDTLRDLVGPLPFRPVVANPAWLVWNDGTVEKLAQAIYEERRFADLP